MYTHTYIYIYIYGENHIFAKLVYPYFKNIRNEVKTVN